MFAQNRPNSGENKKRRRSKASTTHHVVQQRIGKPRHEKPEHGRREAWGVILVCNSGVSHPSSAMTPWWQGGKAANFHWNIHTHYVPCALGPFPHDVFIFLFFILLFYSFSILVIVQRSTAFARFIFYLSSAINVSLENIMNKTSFKHRIKPNRQKPTLISGCVRSVN